MSEQRTRWGWHRLDSKWAERLVHDAAIRRGDLVLDIRAGTGALTGPLVSRGARVIAFELHPRRAQELRARFAGANVFVVQADGSDVQLSRRSFRVVANPPFAISVALLRRLTAPGSQLVRADVIVPWHLGQRWVSGNAPGAGRWRKEFVCSMGPTIPRSAFIPPPPNGVAVVTIQRIGLRRSSMNFSAPHQGLPRRGQRIPRRH